MNLMEIDRRQALGLVAAAALYPGAALSRGGKTLYLNAMTNADWRHGAALFNASGGIVARFELPSRGHGATFNARAKHAVLFARRPGTSGFSRGESLYGLGHPIPGILLPLRGHCGAEGFGMVFVEEADDCVGQGSRVRGRH